MLTHSIILTRLFCSAQYFASRGKAFFYQNMLDNAYDDYKEALRLDPNNADVLMRIQQFDPEGRRDEGSLGGNLGGGGGGHNFTLTNSKSRTSLSLSRNSSTNSLKLPSVTGTRDTQPTSVNPHLKNAVLVKSFVESKRKVTKREMSVNQRRRAHPLKKGAAWSIMETQVQEWKSLSRSKTR